jgi:hypothetical protein
VQTPNPMQTGNAAQVIFPGSDELFFAEQA